MIQCIGVRHILWRERKEITEGALEFEALGNGLSVGIAPPQDASVAAALSSLDVEWSVDYG